MFLTRVPCAIGKRKAQCRLSPDYSEKRLASYWQDQLRVASSNPSLGRNLLSLRSLGAVDSASRPEQWRRAHVEDYIKAEQKEGCLGKHSIKDSVLPITQQLQPMRTSKLIFHENKQTNTPPKKKRKKKKRRKKKKNRIGRHFEILKQ